MIIKCDYCGKEFNKRESHIKRSKHNYCSDICKNLAKNKQIEVKCDYCGKIIKKKQKEIKRAKNHFCCKECFDLYRKQRIKNKCLYCGKEFESVKSRPKKYCSKECQKLNTTKKVKCDNCQKEIVISNYKYKRSIKHFCDDKCKLEYIAKHKYTEEERKNKNRINCRKSWQKHRKKRLQEGRDYYKKNKEQFLKRNKENSEKNKLRHKTLRENFYNYAIEKGLITDCIICGYPKEKTFAIDFHHINPETKKYTISQIIEVKSKRQEAITEIKKCVCMCANCHRLYHNNDEEVVKKYNEVVNAKKL